ncbi:MAG: dTDP-Rha--alpha-D-GlcNAc-pyrophosphate polyprenol alpha-3-L-rhamnosyltransferase [Bacteroidetes bacterium B1(2017)]|nr:MAG: dTDP-Rha--alpha-D-GlcNAc-pyrophosphate polyprenol alpha-3-L-rhamnosyltransferase [Bacteroidetes bacterium B1(2017)]
MKTNQPLVSIITVNYNGLIHTEAFLLSLREITYRNIEIFVVDNASTESIKPLIGKFPEAIFIESKENLGFAGGNNLGIRQAKGKYFFLLNNDTELEKGFLEPLVELMESNEKIGIVSSKLVYHDDPKLIQFAGSLGINMYTGRGFSIGYKELDGPKFDGSYKTQLAHGAAMMFSRKVVEEVGLMAELYFLYYEETDFCERVKRADFEIWYCGASKVFHKESMSVGKSSPMKTYYLTRNRLIFTRRNTSGLQRAGALLFFYFLAFPKGILTFLFKKEFKLLSAFVKGSMWNLTHFHIFYNEGLIIK